MVRGSTADATRADRPRGRDGSQRVPRGQPSHPKSSIHPRGTSGPRNRLSEEAWGRKSASSRTRPESARGLGARRPPRKRVRSSGSNAAMNTPQRAQQRVRRSRRSAFPRPLMGTSGRVESREHPGARAPGGEKEFVSGVLRWVRGRGDSWGTSVRTAPGVLARSGPRGPGPAVREGGETRLRLGRGPELVTAFPPPLFQGKESEASSRALG